MRAKRKVIGENLVIGCFLVNLKTRQTSEIIGGPGTTRTCDPLLRRPIPGFYDTLRNITKSFSTPLLAQLSEEKRPLADSHQKQRFGYVSGEQLVNFPVSRLGPEVPTTSLTISSDSFEFNTRRSKDLAVDCFTECGGGFMDWRD